MHSATADQSPHWVSNWGFCRSCDGLTNDTSPFQDERTYLCKDCTEDERTARLAEIIENTVDQVSVRPRGVIVLVGNDVDPNSIPAYGTLTLPADVSPTVEMVADQMAHRSSQRLRAEDSLEFALENVAGGRDSLARDIRSGGREINPQQVRYALDILERLGLITCTGYLDWFIDPAAEFCHRRAKKYRLNIAFAKLGELARELKRRALNRSSNVGVSTRCGNCLERRKKGLLKWALDNAAEGQRNWIGYGLAKRCKDMGLTYPKTKQTMESYQRDVDQSGHRYTWAEAQRTLSSVYKVKKPAVPITWPITRHADCYAPF